ncbi:MAG: hypothetical protein EAZ73_05440 [Oscillatoriales cyanobacterium]|nr:MAG: hypothetical protein EAZ83_05865 [Oscillatoriales cyanobacterium]TAF22500.1 MAG: hypothetical protein EAZ73_05440 [Oscillatoriales cyanobacterium]
MRYIIVKNESNSDGTISFHGAHKATRKGTKSSIEWIDLKSATTNTIDPDACDLLSFDEMSEAEELLESTGEDEAESTAILGVNAD